MIRRPPISSEFLQRGNMKLRSWTAPCAVLFPLLAAPLSAQVTCTANAPAPTILRVSGNTEPLGDYVVTCTGGVPTPAGSPVPQMNFSLFLNTNLTSKVTAGLLF